MTRLGKWISAVVFFSAAGMTPSLMKAETPPEPTGSQFESVRSDWEHRVLGGGSGGSLRWLPPKPRVSAGAEKSMPAPPESVLRVSYDQTPGSEGTPFVEESEIVPDDPLPGPIPAGDLQFESTACQACGPVGAVECSGSGPCGGTGYAGGICGRPCCWHYGWIRNLSFFSGVQGFKGPPDRGLNGNFGFHEGVNWGAPLGGLCGIGYQVGFQSVHSNFEGDQVAGARTGDRDQVFLTAGLFRRANGHGLQWGIAFDYFHDSYYYGTVDLNQIRTEWSWLQCGRDELGFWGAFGTGEDEFLDPRQGILRSFQPTDLFAFFYRRYFQNGGQGRLWTGFTGEGDALLGADATLPIGRSWALETSVNYLVSKEFRGPLGQAEESWGLAIQLVWYLGRSAHDELRSPYHPLFGVADNSVFMVDFK